MKSIPEPIIRHPVTRLRWIKVFRISYEHAQDNVDGHVESRATHSCGEYFLSLFVYSAKVCCPDDGVTVRIGQREMWKQKSNAMRVCRYDKLKT